METHRNHHVQTPANCSHRSAPIADSVATDGSARRIVHHAQNVQFRAAPSMFVLITAKRNSSKEEKCTHLRLPRPRSVTNVE